MLKFIKCRDVKSPERWTKFSSWYDFFIPYDLDKISKTPKSANIWEFDVEENWCIHIYPQEWVLIPSWIKTIIESWYDLVFDNKSWVAVKEWLIIWASVIDSDYRWEIHLHLINTSNYIITLQLGQKVAQAILRKVELVNPIEITEEEFIKESDTERWTGWFGSTWDK